MQLNIPNKRGATEQQFINIEKSLVIIGANGAGKTRFGTQIESGYTGETHRVSAQKSLKMSGSVSIINLEKAKSEFINGYYQEQVDTQQHIANRVNMKWSQNPNTHFLDDFDKLLVFLQTLEMYELSANKNKQTTIITPLDKVKRIWEDILQHRKLRIQGLTIQTYPTDNESGVYQASEMSDGERIIFYMIGVALCVNENSLLVIDEPELHLHKSITKILWDLIEIERPDCIFIYLTHDIDFAFSRSQSTKIWIKNYFPDQTWDYEVLEESNTIPEQLYLEILGSRKPILFIEGDNSSLDYLLFQHVFTDYTIKPLGNCDKVFDSTKAFNELNEFHQLSARGLIDRDRRCDKVVESVRELGIWVTEVAESENLLLLEDIILIIAKKMNKDAESVMNNIKENVFSLFRKEYKAQATQHAISEVKNHFKLNLNPNVKNLDELKTQIDVFIEEFDYIAIYNELERKFEGLLNTKDYNGVLKAFNNKGLLYAAHIPDLCGLSSKNSSFRDFVISLMKEKSDDGKAIIAAIKGVVR